MIFSLVIFLLCTAGFATALPSDEAAACAARLQDLVEQAEQTQREAMKFKPIPRVHFDPTVPLPPTRPGESAAAADGGLFFDNNASTLTYIGNVRLRDKQLHLRAANRLFLLFPSDDKQKAGDEALGTRQKQQAAPKTTAAAPMPPPAKTGQAPKKSEARDVLPLDVVTVNAAADLRTGRLALEGRSNGDPSLVLSRGESQALLHRQAEKGQSAWIYADELGNVLLRGGKLDAEWKDDEGKSWRLVCTGEFALYRAAAREVIFCGDVVVTTPQGTLHCTRSLSVFFSAKENAVPPSANASTRDKNPFSQFEDMQIKEVDHIVAEGNVSLAIPARQGQPASRIMGETLRYSIASGECNAAGDNPTISFGENTLTTNGEIYLRGNGDIEIQGSKINGSYRRPAPGETPQRLLVGSYYTEGPVTYTAASRTIFLPKGMNARDEAAFFRCTGECRVTLLPGTGAGKPRAKGEPNLAIAHTDGVRDVEASGNVTMHSDASPASPVCDICADYALLNLQDGTALFRTERGKPVDARYGNYALAARSPSGKTSHLQVLPNGDLLAKGEYVAASLPSEKGRSRATCADELRLQREKGVLLMGRAASIETPDGIMTSRGTLQAQLVPGKDSEGMKAPAKYPHLAYNFIGLHTAETHEGGTLRTAQASMQCEGDIIVEIDPNAKKGADRSSIRSALVTNKVRLAGKDPSGRLIRADGDRLTLDQGTGNIVLTGKTVRLQDENNVHTATGAGARITVDPKNNIRVFGAQQTTHSVHLREQIKKNKKQ